MSRIERTDFLAMHGKALIDNGYKIIPIPPGKKAPGYDGWQRTDATQKQLTDWLSNGHTDHGIGILTCNTPAIDLDISDADILKKMQDWCEMNIAMAPVRIGRSPRSMMLFRTTEPFRKMKTGKYEDEWGEQHEIEILADGQQFVAYAIHPETHRPYYWTTDEQPTITPVEDLPLLTVGDAKALLKYFEEVAKQEGWKKVTNGLSAGTRSVVTDDDDPFADFETIVDLPADEIRNRLMMIPGAEDYDLWVQIGMALYHQFGGDDDGQAIWKEWSEVADNYDAESLETHWKSFDIAGKKRSPITARLIIKLAKEASTTLAMQRVSELRDEFFKAKDQAEWRKVCTLVRKAEIDSVSRAEIAEIARKRYTEITGSKLPIVEVRKALAYELPKSHKTPDWCHHWVFDASDDRFFHLQNKISMSMQGFNAVYSRQSLTKKDILEGRTAPSSTPSDLALNVYAIHEVYGRIYSPGQDTLYLENGIRIANLYPEYQVPTVPKELTPKDKRAIRVVMAHIDHLLADEDERRLFLNWLAWIVQNPGKLLKWAMVLQGVEGDGKSFWGSLLRAVMGVSNVKVLNASVLESNFNGWAAGQCVLVIEEPRLQGQNKYDVINRIKPLITNAIIPVHAKGKEPYDVENTTNYFLPTNFRDALPLNDNDRRYCVLFSRWQNREALREFNEENPDYYSNLYRAIEECAPAIRLHLTTHDVDADFLSGGDAPRTKAHSYMVAAAKPEPMRVIQELIDEGEYPDITEHLINATSLPDAMIGRDADIPQTSGLAKLLEQNGYVLLGRVKIEGKYGRFWSKFPEQFKHSQEVSKDKIRAYLKEQNNKIQENEL